MSITSLLILSSLLRWDLPHSPMKFTYHVKQECANFQKPAWILFSSTPFSLIVWLILSDPPSLSLALPYLPGIRPVDSVLVWYMCAQVADRKWWRCPYPPRPDSNTSHPPCYTEAGSVTGTIVSGRLEKYYQNLVKNFAANINFT